MQKSAVRDQPIRDEYESRFRELYKVPKNKRKQNITSSVKDICKFFTFWQKLKMDNEEKLSGSLAAIFNEFTEYAQADQDIRDQIKLKVRELEQGNREAVAILAKIHHADGLKNMEDLLKNVEELVKTKIQERISALSTVIPKGQYFRFHNHFNYR